MTKTKREGNLLLEQRHQLALAELTRREGLISLLNALRYLQALYSEQSMSLGDLYRDEALWQRLPYRIRERQLRSGSRVEWLMQARQIDWQQVHLEICDLFTLYSQKGPSLEAVIQDLVAVDLYLQSIQHSCEKGGGVLETGGGDQEHTRLGR